MKKLDLSQIISTVANLGVIAGIIFLAIELQQNNRLLQAEAIGSAFSAQIDRNEAIYSDERLASLFTRAIAGDELSPVDRRMVGAFYATTLLTWQREFFLYQEGIMSEEQFGANIPTMKLAYETREGRREGVFGPREHWDQSVQIGNRGVTKEFRAFMEQCVFADCDSIPR